MRFGVCAGPTDHFDRHARPSVPDGVELAVLHHQTSIAEAYNRILEESEDGPVVLMHDDVELLEPDLVIGQLEAAFADPQVAIVGVIGSRNPTRLAWKSGSERVGRVVDFCGPDGSRFVMEGVTTTGEVDTLDGLFVAFAPWATQNLRFDTGYPPFDGYDGDICAQARAAGKKVVVAAIDVVHHATNTSEHRAIAGTSFTQADLRWKAKWRFDAPGWHRVLWRVRARLLPLEYKVRRLKWR